MSKQEAVALIAALKGSELEKSHCGKRLVAWYETQKRVYER